MADKKEIQRERRNFISSIVMNILVPWGVYMLLRKNFNNETVPLAIIAAIPTVRTMSIWIWKHNIDWIGVIGTLGFVIAIVASFIFHGSSLVLKLAHPIIFGIIGIVCLISVMLKKPLMLVIARIMRRDDKVLLDNPIVRKKYTIMTVLLGVIALFSFAIHVIMALTLPTSVFVVASRVVGLLVVVVLVISGRIIIGRRLGND